MYVYEEYADANMDEDEVLSLGDPLRLQLGADSNVDFTSNPSSSLKMPTTKNLKRRKRQLYSGWLIENFLQQTPQSTQVITQ